MQTNEKPTRLAFNACAARKYLHGTMQGLRIRIQNGTVFFQPTPTEWGSDVIRLEFRVRGGRFINIDIDEVAIVKNLCSHSTALDRLRPSRFSSYTKNLMDGFPLNTIRCKRRRPEVRIYTFGRSTVPSIGNFLPTSSDRV